MKKISIWRDRSNWRSNVSSLLLFALCGCMLMVWIIMAMTTFMNQATAYEVDETDESLQEIAESNAGMIEFYFDKQMESLTLTAQYFRDTDMEEVEKVDLSYFERAFADLAELGQFQRVSVILPSNTAYVLTDGRLQHQGASFTEEMEKGITFISDGVMDEKLGQIIHLNVPLYNSENRLTGYLQGTLATDQLSEQLSVYLQQKDGYFQLMDSEGYYIADGRADQMLIMDVTFLEGAYLLEFDKGSAEQVVGDFEARNEGHVQYTYEGQTRLAYYAPVEINNWMILLVQRQEAVLEKSEQHINNGVTLIVHAGIVFLLLILWAYYAQNKMKENAQVYEKSFRLLSDQINRVIFEWNTETKELKFMSDTHGLFEGRKKLQNWPILAGQNKDIYEKDYDGVCEAMQAIQDGNRVSDVKCRLKQSDGSYSWYMMAGVPVYHKDEDKPLQVLGLLEEVDAVMRESIELKKRSERDSLTGIYNKGTTEVRIKQILEEDEAHIQSHALFIIDVDNFKSINDTLGHQVGDEVICQLAQELRKMFRPSDIVGRIGGDEFFAFMNGVSDQTIIEQKAKNICECFRKQYGGEEKAVIVSASVGIACYQQHGLTFETLYKNADIALYLSKQEGKNRYTFFNGQSDVNYISNRTVIENGGEEKA